MMNRPVLEVVATDTTGEVEEVAVTNDGGPSRDRWRRYTKWMVNTNPALDAEEDVVTIL